MFAQILNSLGLADTSFNNQGISRRKHHRHPGIHAEVNVGGRAYSVRDWSLGGVFFETPPDSRMVVGDKIAIDLKFRLPHETVTIQHSIRVVRAATRGIAAEFAPLNADIRRQFDRVIDFFNAQSFLQSQVA